MLAEADVFVAAGGREMGRTTTEPEHRRILSAAALRGDSRMRSVLRPWFLVGLTSAVTAAVFTVMWIAGAWRKPVSYSGLRPIPTEWIAKPLGKAIAGHGDVAGVLGGLQRDARKCGYLIEERPHSYLFGQWGAGDDWVEVTKESGKIVVNVASPDPIPPASNRRWGMWPKSP